jgi:hypothetical protein
MVNSIIVGVSLANSAIIRSFLLGNNYSCMDGSCLTFISIYFVTKIRFNLLKIMFIYIGFTKRGSVFVPTRARYLTKNGALQFAQTHSIPVDVMFSFMQPTSFERQSYSGEDHLFTYIVSKNSVSSADMLSYSRTLLAFIEYFKTDINGTVEDARFVKSGELPKILDTIVCDPIQLSNEQRDALFTLNEHYR